MGGLPLLSSDSVQQISQALTAHSNGDNLPFYRLQHGLNSKDSTILSSILTGLTHFTTTLYQNTSQAQIIRQLVEAALSIDLFACVAEPSALPALLIFCKNLCSAHAASIEPIFKSIIGRSLALPISDPRTITIRQTSIELVSFILKTHPRAASVLIVALRRKYPHPVRPAAEHAAFARGILTLARNINLPSVSDVLVEMVIDRLASVEALAGDDVLLPVKQSNEQKENEVELTPEANRVQLIAMELLTHIDEVKQTDQKEKGKSDASKYTFEQIFAAYEKSIISVQKTRVAPYILIYAGERAGEDQILEAIERLREAFFDCSFSSRLRGKFLEHSSSLVIRSRSLSAFEAFKWISKLARWLNAYIDEQKSFEDDHMTDIDTDMHFLFYEACSVLMTTITRRKDAFIGKGHEYRDVMAKMRLYRIMASDMNPMLVLPNQIVKEFVDVATVIGSNTQFRELLNSSRGGFIPTRTIYGSRNIFEFFLPCPDLTLPDAYNKVMDVMRWDKDMGLHSCNRDFTPINISNMDQHTNPTTAQKSSINAQMVPMTL